MDVIQHHFKMKKPCEDCPFLKEGAIELNEGRLEGIVEDLLDENRLAPDGLPKMSTFHCHKSVYSKNGGTTDEEGKYNPSHKESMCAGAMIYLMKIGRPTIGMRMGMAWDVMKKDDLMSHQDLVIDELKIKTVE